MADHSEEQLIRLKGLNAVYQALSAVELSAFSLSLLLQIVLETGTKLTGAKYGALGVFDESGAKLTEFITVGLDEETKKRIGTSPMGFGLLGAMADEPGVIRLRDLTRHPKSVGFPPHHPSMKSFLGVSIRTQGRIFGRLYLTEKQGAEEFSEIDAEIVTALASQAGTILERGLLIDKLKSAEARHRHILESAAEGIYGLDLDGSCTFINKAGAAMLGYRPEELIGRRMHSLVHHTRPDGSPYPEEECPTERSRRHGRPSHLIEDSYWRKDGAAFPVQLSCAPILSDGALRGSVVTFFDVTDRREAERRKALDHGIARAVIESATSGEANQKILQTVCEVLGWEWSAVWEVDKQANVLRSMVIWHKPEIAALEFEAITRQMTFAPGVGLPGRVWSSGAPAYIPDVTRDPNFPRAPFAAQAGLRSGFAFPIRIGGDIVAVMEFFSRESRKPSSDVMNLLATLGSQIGLQIERKRAEETIKKSRDYHLKLLEEFPSLIWKSGLDAKCDYFNKSWLAFTGRTMEQELGDGWAEGVHPEDRDRCVTTYLAAFHARKPFEMEYRLRHHDGGYRSIVDVGRPYSDLDGNFAGFVGSAYDITERKRAGERLRHQEERLAAIVNTAMDAIITVDSRQRVTVFNAAAEHMFRCSAAEAIGQALDRFIPERFRAKHREHIRAFGQSGVTSRRLGQLGAIRGLRANNEEFPVEASISQIVVEGEKYFTVILRDITERKRAEAALHESEERFRTLAESLPHLVWTCTADGHCDYLSRQWIEYTGRPEQEQLGYGWIDQLHPDDRQRVEAAWAAATARGDQFDVEFRIRRADGVYRWFKTRALPMRDEADRIVKWFGSNTDFEDYKRAEQRLREMHVRLQQAQEEERKRIAREIHDELGQQLTMLRFGLVKLAQTEQQPPAELRKQARVLTQPVDTMIDTVRRIATTLRPAILDDLGLTAALEWLITDFRTKTNISCDMSLAPVSDELDGTRSITLFRILQEALTNVARHAQATHVKIRLQQTGDTLVLEVKDNGRGLTEAQRTSPAAIGLFGMQERALLVGGTVMIESRPKEGTTVTARIPIR